MSRRHNFAAYNATTDEIVHVPETELPHVAFCDLARMAWATLREALRLPPVDPLFDWTEERHSNDGVRIGDHVTVDNSHALLTDQCDITLWPGDHARACLRGWSDVVAGYHPEVFGALPTPLGLYYAVRLHAPVDSLSVRVLHTYLVAPVPGHGPGWVTRFDVLFARGPA